MNSEAVFKAAFLSSELALLPLMKMERRGINFYEVLCTQRENCHRHFILLQHLKCTACQLEDDAKEQRKIV